MKRIAAVLPWFLATALLIYLFARTPFSAVIQAVRESASWTVPCAIVCVMCVFFADAFSISKTFRYFTAPVTLSDALIVRGASYLLAAINYNVGQGAIVFFVTRVTGVPVLKATGTILLMMGVNILLLLAFATGGLFTCPDVPRVMVTIVAIAYVGVIAYSLVIAHKPLWLKRWPILDTLLSAGWYGHLYSIVVRLPHLTALMAFHYAMLRAFRIEVPPAQALLTLPIVFFVGVLPISIQGIGTSQAMAIFFYAPFAVGTTSHREAMVLAYSLSAQVIATMLQAILGIICLRTERGRMLWNWAKT